MSENTFCAEIQAYNDKIEQAPINAEAKRLANIYVQSGKQACLTELNALIIKKKLKTWESSVLSARIREILVNNGNLLQ